MAGHLNVMAIEKHSAALQKAIKSINYRLDKNKRYVGRERIWYDHFYQGKKFMRLPEEYTDEWHKGFIAFDVGCYKVGQRLVHGGVASFELHYNPKTNERIIYLVA